MDHVSLIIGMGAKLLENNMVNPLINRVVAWDIFFLYDEGAEMDSLFQPWVSTGRTIMGARDKLKTDFEALINTSKND